MAVFWVLLSLVWYKYADVSEILAASSVLAVSMPNTADRMSNLT